MNVYIHPSGTQKSLTGGYIGKYPEWQPGANTLAYFPLTEDTADHSGSYTLTSKSNAQQTLGWDFTGYCKVNMGTTAIKTLTAWIKIKNYDGPYTEALRYNKGYFQYYKYHQTNSALSNTITVFTSSSYAASSASYTLNLNERYHVAFINDTDNSKTYGYINGVKVFEGPSPYNFNLSDVYLWADRDGSYSHFYTGTATLSDVIIENSAWSAADVLSYYNGTKSTYGL